MPFPRRVALQFIEPYIREERSIAVARWRAGSGARQANSEALIGCLADGDRIHLYNQHLTIPASKLSISERKRLILVPDKHSPLEDGEPALLWLQQDGTAMAPTAWQSVFNRAEARCKKHDLRMEVGPHTLRHTFAVYWLSHLIKAEVGQLEPFAKLKRDDRQRDLYLRLVGDPLRQIQKWLGHSSSTTTERYLLYIDEVKERIEVAAEFFDNILAQKS